jgi:prevent-host-death family protein
MTKTVTATEAKNRLGSLMNEVIESNEPVIIELRGRPKIALITTDRLEEIERLEWEQRRAKALANLDKLGKALAGQNNDLTEEEAMELAVEVTREVRREMREPAIAPQMSEPFPAEEGLQ